MFESMFHFVLILQLTLSALVVSAEEVPLGILNGVDRTTVLENGCVCEYYNSNYYISYRYKLKLSLFYFVTCMFIGINSIVFRFLVWAFSMCFDKGNCQSPRYCVGGTFGLVSFCCPPNVG